MNFDAAASAGNSLIDLLGTAVSEGASAGTTPQPWPFQFAVTTTEIEPPTDHASAPLEPAVDDFPFFTVLEDATIALNADTEETGSEDLETDEIAPIQRAVAETVAPETLRLIFPVHYFYSDQQMNEAVAAVDPAASKRETLPPTPSTPALTTGAAATLPPIPMAPAPQLAPAPEPTTATASSLQPEMESGDVVESIPGVQSRAPVASVGVPPAPVAARSAVIEQPAPPASAEPASNLPARQPASVKHYAPPGPNSPPEIPTPRTDARVDNATVPPAPIPAPRHAAIEQEALPAASRASAVEASSAAAPVLSQSSQGETGQDDRAHDGRDSDREPMPEPQAASAKRTHTEAPRKDDGTERKNPAIHPEQRPSSIESSEFAPRPLVTTPRDSAEPVAPKPETSGAGQASAKAPIEPATPAPPARSVSISVAGPRGEDVRAVVQATGDGVQVRLQAGDERTQQALQMGAPELRHRLEEVQRVPSGDVWDSVGRTADSIADVQAPEARFGSQYESNSRDSSPSREDQGGQRQGQRGSGRGERDPEAADEEFASHFQQGGKS